MKNKSIEQDPIALISTAGTQQRRLAEEFFQVRSTGDPGENLAEASYLKDGHSAVNAREWDEFSPEEYAWRRAERLKWLSRNIYVEAIFSLRQNQIARFSDYSSDIESPGWRVVPSRPSRNTDVISLDDARDIEILSAAIQDNGFGGELDGKECFSEFLNKIACDSMVFDQMNVEIIHNKSNGKILRWKHVPAVSIGITNNYSFNPEYAINGFYPKYFQHRKGVKNALFYPFELTFYVRKWNYRNIETNYGDPELFKAEQAIMALNAYHFLVRSMNEQGYFGNKLLSLSGGGDENVVNASTVLRTALSGKNQAFKHGVIDEGAGAKILELGSTFDETWIAIKNEALRTLCAMLSTSPEEINHPMDDHQVSRDRTGRAADKERSLETGLVPIMTAISNMINRNLLGPICNYKYKFEWTGNSPHTMASKLEQVQEAVKTVYTVNEGRAILGKPPIPNGDIVLDTNISQVAVDEAVRLQQMGQIDPASKSGSINSDGQASKKGISDMWG